MPTAIRVYVNGTLIPWILIKQKVAYDIEFYNSDSTNNIRVNFDGQRGAPPDIDREFTVENGGGAKGFTLTTAAANGSYPYSTGGGGGGGNGGIEIDT